jgi:hypothetical protein
MVPDQPQHRETRLTTPLDDLFARNPEMAGLAAEVIAMVGRVAPSLAGKVQLGWNSVNFTHPKAGYVCAVVPTRTHVSLVFAHGRELDHPRLIDDGKVTRVRWIAFAPGEDLIEDEIAILIAEAIALRA